MNSVEDMNVIPSLIAFIVFDDVLVGSPMMKVVSVFGVEWNTAPLSSMYSTHAFRLLNGAGTSPLMANE